MSSDNDTVLSGTNSSPESPAEMAEKGLETALDMIGEIDDGDAILAMTTEREALETFADTVAEASVQGLTESKWTHYCGHLADESPHLNKTDIRSAVKDRISQRTAPGDDDYPTILGYLESNTKSVVAVRSTDAKQSTLYRWHFEDESVGTYQIETGGSTETSHYNWRQLRSAIFDASGNWTAAPPDNAADDWPEIIGPFIEARSEEVTHKGPRSCAIESLQNHVYRSTAFARVEDMVTHEGVMVNADPESGEATELKIANTDVSRVCDDHSVSERALQVELEARGYTVERVNGVAETTFVHGDKFTTWVLSADFAAVSDYEPDPESVTERFERKLREDRDREGEGEEPGTGPDNTADDESRGEGGDGDEDGGETGLIGSTGPENEPNESDDPANEDGEENEDSDGETETDRMWTDRRRDRR